MNIAVVLGTARTGRKSEAVAQKLTSALATRADVAVTFVDVREHVRTPVTVPAWEASEEFQAWRDIATNSDVFVFVLPEYNHGYPGEWKLLVDAAYREYQGKRAYIVGVSNGTFAGVRVADHVKPILVELGLQVYKTAWQVGNVTDAFTPEGEFADQSVHERMEKFIDTITTP